MFYITGDTHGSYSHIEKFVKRFGLTEDDTVICLGDSILNDHGDERDRKVKERVQRIPVTLLCVHGNHDRRPETLPGYGTREFHGGTVYFESEFPRILFAQDGEVYDFDGLRTMVVGGAYSIDKDYRLERGFHWFPDEQPSDLIKKKAEDRLSALRWKLDVMLTHTCPLKYLPPEALFKGIDQSTVDKSTECWLGTLERRLDYQAWYCGHFHINKKVDRMVFLYKDILLFEGDSPDESAFE